MKFKSLLILPLLVTSLQAASVSDLTFTLIGDIDGDGNMDVNEDVDGDGNLDVAEDIDGDGNLDVDEDCDGDNSLDVNEDIDGDGNLDVHEDIDGDGKLDVAEDLDNDNNFDIVNEDVNGNGILDPGEDLDGDNRLDDGTEDIDGDGFFDIAEDVDGDGNLDVAEDVDGDGNLDVNCDLDGDGNLDVDEDIDGDGRLDVAEDVDGDGRLDVAEYFSYSVTDCLDTASGSLDIPSTYNGLPVTSIGSNAFQNCSGLTSINIPSSVTSIGNEAFSGCTSLSNLTCEGDAPTFGTNVFSESDSVTIYYYDDSSGFSTPTFQGRPSQMLIRSAQFQIIEGDFTWHEAKADAVARGGRLAVLNTQEKIDAANEYLLSLGTWNNAYIGLTDEEVEGSWKWVTGELLTVDNWNSGEPNGSTNENYGHIIGSYHSSRLLWNDSRITSVYSYILEAAIPAPDPLAPILNLETFYESNSGESITIDGTPTDGYPTTYTYQWYWKPIGINNYIVIPSIIGGTASNYQISGNSVNNATWKVEVTNEAGTTAAEFNYRVYADSDSDGLSDGQEEFVLGTDPNDNDSDDDSLLDGAETNTGTWVSTSDTGTNPLSNDSDSDGLLDGVETNTAEYIDATDTGTDPNDSDTDNDGLLDGAETNTNVYVSSSDTGTHPLNTDSDADGYSDYVETNTGTWTSSGDTGTDPNRADTDNDGIIDGRETNTGTFVSLTDTGTDPNNTDSDGDGFTDKFEIDTSYDPTSSDDTPDAYSFIETAVEVNFYGAIGGTYRIEHTDDIESDTWVTVENDIQGSSELIERLYSTDDYSRRFFRVVRTDQ